MRMMQLRRGDGAISAVGEQYNTATLRKAWRRVSNPDNIVIALVPEPENRHDSNAVRMDILIDGTAYKAGYVASDEAQPIHQALTPLQAAGIMGYGYGKIREDAYLGYQVYVRLSRDPTTLIPPTIDDPIGVYIDGYYPLTVIGEERFQDVLEPYARANRDYVFAMHPTVVSKGKYAGERTYAVYLDGQVVGELTRAMAVRHSAQFDAVFQAGQRPYLLGRVETDHRGRQVVLEQPHYSTR